MEGLQTFTNKIKAASGVNTSWYDDMFDMFGRYKHFVATIFTSIAVFVAIMVLCGCCCVPCIRQLTIRTLERTMGPLPSGGQYMLIPQKDLEKEDDNVDVPLRDMGV